MDGLGTKVARCALFEGSPVKRPVLAALCALGVSLAALPGRATPSLWERTLAPKSKRAAALTRSLGRMIEEAHEAADNQEVLQDFRLAAVAMAELSGAAALEDPALLLLYGHLLLDANSARESEARALSEQLLERVGPGELWLEAEARALLARAERDDATQAIANITRGLALTWDARVRSALLRERANVRMALGELALSAKDLRAALAVAERPEDRALARYALGLTLERSADLPAALAELRHAEAIQASLGSRELSLLETHELCLFRPFDRHYVLALTAMALAEREDDPERAGLELERASVEWERFEIAAPADDPWLANARLHRGVVEQRRDSLAEEFPEESEE